MTDKAAVLRIVLAFLLGVFVTIGVVAWLADRDCRREWDAPARGEW